MINITVNTRTLGNHLTGAQRYTLELLSRFRGKIQEVNPGHPLSGVRGHAWEQFILPIKVKGDLLWSPSNTGPLVCERQVVTLHDVTPMDHPEWLNPRFAAWYRFLTPRLVGRVRSIITVSEFTKQRIVAYCPEAESKIHVVHNGVDAMFHPIEVDLIQRTRERLHIPSPHYLVALGSLEPRKNLPRLLQAWAMIQGKISDDVWLVMTGAHGRRLVYGEVSFENLPPRVHFTGHVPDELLPALYSGAIAAPYLSLYEGFGFPPLEAMACGTPILTGNLTSLPEVVGDAGIMVDPYDVEAIADRLKNLIEDSVQRDDLRLAGLKRAKQFSWDKAAELTWRVMEDAAQR